MKKHWLDDKRNVDRIVYALYGICALLIGIDLFYHKHASVGFDGTFGFYALFGFVACVALVLAAKALRTAIKRDEDYYDR